MYFLAINQLKSEFKSFELSLEFDEQEDWGEEAISSGAILQAGKWGEHGAIVIMADSESEARTIAENCPLFEYELIDIEILSFSSLPYLEKHRQTASSEKEDLDSIYDDKAFETKLLCLEETKTFKVNGFDHPNQMPIVQKDADKESVILVLDGVIEAMVDHKLETVQKFQTLKIRQGAKQNLAASQSLKNQLGNDK